VSGEEERERVALELRRIRDGVRERALLEDRPATLPAAREGAPAAGIPPPEPAAPAPAPAPPDGAPVNESWDLGRVGGGGGLRGLAARLVLWALRPWIDAQTAFNSRQVQLDNQLLEHLSERFDHTHAHYDRVLGIHGRHLADVDERHLILQEELVAHVHDLVKRTDLVLAEAERGRLSLRFQLQDLRRRLERLEERLRRE